MKNNEHEKFNILLYNRAKQHTLVLLYIATFMWPLWIIFDYYLVPEIAVYLSVARVLLSIICIALIILLKFSIIKEHFAQNGLLYTAYIFVAVVVNVVPEDKILAFFIGATMILVAGFFYMIIPPVRLIFYGFFSTALVLILTFVFKNHSLMTIIEKGGIMYFSITIFSMGLSWIHYRNVTREIRQNIEIEEANQKLNAQQKLLQEQNNQIITQKENLEQKNTELTVSLKEREVLLKEIHHRVKNNLQIISSLLNLQSEKTENNEVRNILKISQSRIEAMSMIHENLYKSSNFSEISTKEYFQNLCRYIQTSFNLNEKNIIFKLKIDDVKIEMDKIVPCGLIVNELITNCLKHAFDNCHFEKIISFSCQSTDNSVQISISDNGNGLPDNFNINKTKSIGLRLATGLAKQLNSELIFENKNGLFVKFQFPNFAKNE